jgi:hypothetical protein
MVKAVSPTRRLWSRQVGRRKVVAEWLPAGLYTRAEVFCGRDRRRGDGSVTVTLGRLTVGVYWGPRRRLRAVPGGWS